MNVEQTTSRPTMCWYCMPLWPSAEITSSLTQPYLGDGELTACRLFPHTCIALSLLGFTVNVGDPYNLGLKQVSNTIPENKSVSFDHC